MLVAGVPAWRRRPPHACGLVTGNGCDRKEALAGRAELLIDKTEIKLRRNSPKQRAGGISGADREGQVREVDGSFMSPGGCVTLGLT